MSMSAGTLIEIVHVGTFFSQQVLTVWDFEIQEPGATGTMVQILEGYWNHIKATYRAMCQSTNGAFTMTLRGRELNNSTGEYAEFDIPVGEQAGTRAPTAQPDWLPPFSAVGARLTVGSRTTRPGQKRFSVVSEADSGNGGGLQAALKTAVQNYLTVAIAEMTLGAPAALTIIKPVICRKNAAGAVSAHQSITGFLVNNNVTTQNTRKIGRGA